MVNNVIWGGMGHPVFHLNKMLKVQFFYVNGILTSILYENTIIMILNGGVWRRAKTPFPYLINVKFRMFGAVSLGQ